MMFATESFSVLMLLPLCVLLSLCVSMGSQTTAVPVKTRAAIEYKYDLISPRSGDLLLAKYCKEKDDFGLMCSYQVDIIAMVSLLDRSIIEEYDRTQATPKSFINARRVDYEIDVYLHYKSAPIHVHFPGTALLDKVAFSYYGSINFFALIDMPYFQIDITVHDVAGEIRSKIAEYSLIVGLETPEYARDKYPLDLFESGLRVCDPYASSNPADIPPSLSLSLSPTIPSAQCSLDYIEIGTSNFDTAAQAAHTINMENPHGRLISGISIEAIDSYLKQLPKSDSNILVNAAITIDQISKNETAVSTIYYLLESTIEKLNGFTWLKGCSMVGQVHQGILAFLYRHDLPVELIRRTPVPQMSIDILLRTVMLDANYDRIGLLKLDVEGMDQHLVHQTLDFFDSNLAGADVRSPKKSLPCVLYFETWEGIIDSILLTKLKLHGYMLVHEHTPILDKIESMGGVSTVLEDCVAILCSCTDQDILRAASLLYAFTPSLAVEVCAANRAAWL